MSSTLTSMLVALTCLLAATLGPAAGQNYREGRRTRWGVYSYPNPYSVNQEQQALCGRLNQSYVCDPNSIITTTEANAIDAEIKKVMRDTPCNCFQCAGKVSDKGYKIRVALMQQMERVNEPEDISDRLEQLRDARLYSYILSRRWRFDGYCNETLLIVFSRADRLVYTLTMPHAKTRLADYDITQITMLTRSYFDRRETIADGIIQMIRRYSLCFQGKSTEAVRPGEIIE